MHVLGTHLYVKHLLIQSFFLAWENYRWIEKHFSEAASCLQSFLSPTGVPIPTRKLPCWYNSDVKDSWGMPTHNLLFQSFHETSIIVKFFSRVSWRYLLALMSVEIYTTSIQSLLNVYPGMENLVECQTVKDAFSEIIIEHCKPLKR